MLAMNFPLCPVVGFGREDKEREEKEKDKVEEKEEEETEKTEGEKEKDKKKRKKKEEEEKVRNYGVFCRSAAELCARAFPVPKSPVWCSGSAQHFPNHSMPGAVLGTPWTRLCGACGAPSTRSTRCPARSGVGPVPARRMGVPGGGRQLWSGATSVDEHGAVGM